MHYRIPSYRSSHENPKTGLDPILTAVSFHHPTSCICDRRDDPISKKRFKKVPHHLLVGGWTNSSDRYYSQIGFIFPKFRGGNMVEIKKYMKPPPRYVLYLMHYLREV